MNFRLISLETCAVSDVRHRQPMWQKCHRFYPSSSGLSRGINCHGRASLPPFMRLSVKGTRKTKVDNLLSALNAGRSPKKSNRMMPNFLRNLDVDQHCIFSALQKQKFIFYTSYSLAFQLSNCCHSIISDF